MTRDRPAAEPPGDGPPTSGAHGERADATIALHATLVEKTRLLIQRERDVQVLLRKVQEANRWTEQSAVIAARIASTTSIRDACETLAFALAEDFGFEYAVVRWRGSEIEAPELPTELSRARVRALLLDCETSQATIHDHHWDRGGDGEIEIGTAILVPIAERKGDAPSLFVGRTARTAHYSLQSSLGLLQSLERMVHIVAQSFEAVSLNIALAHERDSLQLAVEAATSDLRLALAAAEEARAEAVRAASARTEFLANMSHEIRTPMSAVLGYADLLSDPSLDAQEQAQYLATIRASGKHLLQLIDDILDLARIESGHVDIDPQPASILTVLDDAVSMLQVRAAQKGIDLALVQASPLPSVASIDAARLRQIVINLVGNAVKFTLEGSVLVTMGMAAGNLSVTVADTGVGIPPDKLEHIFAPFEQSNASTSRQFGGTGLGLAISRRLARLMGGDIRVVSALGIGTRFTLQLPVRTTAERAPPPTAVPPTVATPCVGTRILLVEDTLVNRLVIERFLTKAGYEVETAADGIEALDAVARASHAEAPYDLILLDMQMPNLDGYGCAEQLRQTGSTVPIVALTAHAMAGDRERCRDAGCTDYLTKPVERASLIDTVRLYIGSPPAGP